MNRSSWVDNAKAIGMFLIFYGHIAERIWSTGSSTAFVQLKFIYAFHVPLFFIMAGFFAKREPISRERFKTLITRRLLPVLTFGLLLLPLWPIHYYLKSGSIPWEQLGRFGLSYFEGKPRLNWVTWFLVCLFSCEVFAGLLFHRIQQRFHLAVAGGVALVGGLLICRHLPATEFTAGLSDNVWFVQEAIVALGFYLLGYLLFPFLNVLSNSSYAVRAAVFILSTTVLWTTFNLNTLPDTDIVMMCASAHGQMLPFLAASLAGALSILSVSMIIPSCAAATFIGRNTLIYLGLNGIFHHFLNSSIVGLLTPHDLYMPVTVYTLGLTILSLALCLPVVAAIRSRVPQLVGYVSTPEPAAQKVNIWPVPSSGDIVSFNKDAAA